MTVVAGVDVGNTTTEVVLVDLDDVSGPRPVAWDRAPTRGVKGSAESLHGAAVLLRRLERRAEHAASVVAMARLRPVRTAAASVEQPAPPTGRLLVVDVSGGTTGGTGTGVGRPVRVDDGPEGGGPVVALVPAGTGYETAVGTVTGWLALGVDVRAVLLADDEAVLVAAPPAGADAGRRRGGPGRLRRRGPRRGGAAAGGAPAGRRGRPDPAQRAARRPGVRARGRGGGGRAARRPVPRGRGPYGPGPPTGPTWARRPGRSCSRASAG